MINEKYAKRWEKLLWRRSTALMPRDRLNWVPRLPFFTERAGGYAGAARKDTCSKEGRFDYIAP